MPPKDLEKTRYVELISQDPNPAFDEIINTAGYSEIRLWVHIHVDNPAAPILGNAVINVCFMHKFTGGLFVYASGVITNKSTTINGDSDIYGCLMMPIIGDNLQIQGEPENLPNGPYKLDVTYYLVR
jgi:hypothetical protein